MLRTRLLGTAAIAAVIAALGSSPASATLHGFCYGVTPACADNGTNTPTATNPPNFGFTTSPGPQTGDFRVDVLVPNSLVTSPGALSFTITGTQGGSTNTSPISETASLFSTTAWTTGQLDTYLGISASPTNPIGAFLPSTNALITPDATGFYVYQADLGSTQVQANPDALSGPLLNLGGSALPQGSYLVGFLLEAPGTGTPWEGTANSGAIFETGTPNQPVPEPVSAALLGVGLIGLGVLRRRSA